MIYEISGAPALIYSVVFLTHAAFRPRWAYNAIVRRLSTSYPISILFGLFESACACALKLLTDFRNFN